MQIWICSVIFWNFRRNKCNFLYIICCNLYSQLCLNRSLIFIKYCIPMCTVFRNYICVIWPWYNTLTQTIKTVFIFNPFGTFYIDSCISVCISPMTSIVWICIFCRIFQIINDCRLYSYFFWRSNTNCISDCCMVETISVNPIRNCCCSFFQSLYSNFISWSCKFNIIISWCNRPYMRIFITLVIATF